MIFSAEGQILSRIKVKNRSLFLVSQATKSVKSFSEILTKNERDDRPKRNGCVQIFTEVDCKAGFRGRKGVIRNMCMKNKQTQNGG